MARIAPGACPSARPLDIAQLAHVIRTCRDAPSQSEAGRRLFPVSRAGRISRNDADRLRKSPARFDLDWSGIIN